MTCQAVGHGNPAAVARAGAGSQGPPSEPPGRVALAKRVRSGSGMDAEPPLVMESSDRVIRLETRGGGLQDFHPFVGLFGVTCGLCV